MTDLYGLLIASQGYVGQETPGKVSAPPPSLWIHLHCMSLHITLGVSMMEVIDYVAIA